jgi:hypothetical protein
MGITKIRLCVLGSCLRWEKEATPVTHQLGERHIQTYGSVDKRHVPRDDGTFMSKDVSVSTAQRGNLYSKRIDNRTFTALTYGYMEQCLLFLLQVKINHMKKVFCKYAFILDHCMDANKGVTFFGHLALGKFFFGSIL